MADFGNVPTFTKGEPGFADKLNELGGVLRQVIDHLNTSCPAASESASTASKTPVRKTATSR